MSAQSPFPWTDSYLLGFPPMDDTHREFVEIVNAMLAANDEAFLSHMRAFAVHAERHFAEERTWMEETDFPATQCHVDEHAAVMKSVQQVEQIVAQGDVAEGRRLAAELQRWFPGHADYMDSALSHWMSKKRWGGKPVVLRRNILERDPSPTSSQSSQSSQSS